MANDGKIAIAIIKELKDHFNDRFREIKTDLKDLRNTEINQLFKNFNDINKSFESLKSGEYCQYKTEIVENTKFRIGTKAIWIAITGFVGIAGAVSGVLATISVMK